MNAPTLSPPVPARVAPAPVRGARGGSPRWDLGLFAAALALAAWAVGRQFAVEWESNPQYSYGWTVPFLGGLLLVRRWRERPTAERPAAAGLRGQTPGWLVLAGVALLWAPLRVVQEANPDWRPWGWLMAMEMLGLAGAEFFILGGWRWVRWFAFPLGFLLVAAPWPERLETACIQGLMRGVATVAVEFLDLIGIPAVQRGNLIEVGRGLIGVEEACSGIRSLQATLMAGLFLGEFYRVPGWGRRTALLAAGAVLALGTNLARTLFLVFIDVRQGSEAFARWHDRAGLATLCTCLFGLWLVALWLVPRDREGGTPPAVRAPYPTPRLPLAAVGCLAGWMVGTELFTEGWYRWRGETGTGAAVTWIAHPPAGATGLRSVEIPEASRALLRYNEGMASAWLDQGSERSVVSPTPNEHWTLFFARWVPGRAAAASAKMHTPKNCLTAAGKILLADLGADPIEVGSGLALPLHAYRFDAGGGRELHVFHCLWEDRPAALRKNPGAIPEDPDELGAGGRLRAAWAGRRNLGQRVLEISVLGPTDSAQALARVARQLPAMVQATTP